MDVVLTQMASWQKRVAVSSQRAAGFNASEVRVVLTNTPLRRHWLGSALELIGCFLLVRTCAVRACKSSQTDISRSGTRW